ncbi:hypothetical protein [Sphingopyxis sp.]|uniref:hypothetical protein n=1 Tax=Sphingopyxis sp. TaxID=1908224 RepID=UPI0025F64FD1|nr:hypothetical protein [Sphingopyxis sp.]MBK6413988.1 hypothetical protein [Sphingopyxis sp.]
MIAAALREARSNYSLPNVAIYHNGIDNAAHRLADALGRDNPRFDRDRFLAAAGVQS